MKISLKSCAAFFPGKQVDSHDLERQAGLPKGWTEKNNGVLTRYWSDAGDTVTSIGSQALQRALNIVGMNLKELDLLLFAGGSFDHPIPYNACLIKQALDTHHAPFPCFDVDSTCLSFIHALDVSQLYLQSGKYRRIAIVSAELPSSSLNPNDSKTYTLFGDAAVAVILEVVDDRSTAKAYEPGISYFVNYSEGADLAMVPAGGLKQPGFSPETPREAFYFRMDGRKLIALTLRMLDDFVVEWEKRAGRKLTDYDFIIPHQTSKFGNEIFLHRYGIAPEKVILNLHRLGNCVSASIPLGLTELFESGKIKAGSKVLLLGSAAGLSIGGLELNF
jgi:3-oxoacyl-[acyl-carrier-protein] synthase-3